MPVSEIDLERAIYSTETTKKSIRPSSGFHLEKFAKSKKKQYFEKQKNTLRDPITEQVFLIWCSLEYIKV